jgi:hypothetical protein
MPVSVSTLAQMRGGGGKQRAAVEGTAIKGTQPTPVLHPHQGAVGRLLLPHHQEAANAAIVIAVIAMIVVLPHHQEAAATTVIVVGGS